MFRLLLLAAAAVAAAPTDAPALRAWLLLPPETTEEARVEVEGTRVMLQRLLGPVHLVFVDSPEGDRQALRLDSTAFDPALDAGERKQIMEILKGFWGPEFILEEPPSGSKWPWAAPELMKDRVKTKKTSKRVARIVSGFAFAELINEEAQAAGIDPELVRAVAAAKSGMDPDAWGGLMVISRPAARSVGVDDPDLKDPRNSIRAGARLLAQLLDRFDGDVDRALAAYQAGEDAAQKRAVFARSDVKTFLKFFKREYHPKPKKEPPSPLPVPRPTPTAVSGPFESEIQGAAGASGLDAAIVRAVVAAKSGFSAQHYGGGAYGLMMVSPGAAETVGMKGVNLRDPETNLKAGTLYLKRLLKQFGGDLHRALAAYQAGPGTVRKSGGIPNRKDVRDFLSDFELAYQGDPHAAPLKAAVPPRHPNARRLADEAKSLIYKDPKDPFAVHVSLARRTAERHSVDPDLVVALMRRENPWGDPKRVSDAGAIGLMQLMPDTANDCKADPYNANENIDCGVRYLKSLLERFNNDPVLAVAAYNAGHVIVSKLKRVPNYRQTVIHVVEVFNNYYDLTGKWVDWSPHMSTRALRWARRANARRANRRVSAAPKTVRLPIPKPR